MGSKGISEDRQTDRHPRVCMHTYLYSTPQPSSPPPKCLHKISLGNQAEEREAERSETKYSYSVMVRLLQRPLVQLCGVLYTVPLTVQQEDNYCAQEGTMI